MKKFLVGMLVMLLILGGCSAGGTATKYTREEAVEILENADVIKVRKSGLGSFFGNKYIVSVDGEEVATVSGKYIKITGDVFTLRSTNGDVMSKEKQMKRWNIKFNRSARIYDHDNQTTGYINEEVFKDYFNIGYKFHFYNKDKKEVGYTQQKIFTLTLDNNVYDEKDRIAYEIKGNLINFVDTEFTIYVKDKESSVDVESVIFFTAIVNEIAKSE